MDVRVRVKWVTGSALVLAALIQVVPVDRTNPPVLYEVPASDGARAILRRSCYDCHSNETRWPWYSRVAPISWLIAYDVSKGRDAMNFSEWDGYDPAEQIDLMERVLEEIDEDRMPLWYYRPLHPRTQLSDADVKALENWILSDGNRPNTVEFTDARR